MQAYIAKRLLLALPTLFGVSVIIFLILRAIPGDAALIALGIAMVVGLVTGIIAAVKQDTAVDYVARLISIVGYSVPSFWLGPMLIVLPAIWWRYPYPLGFVPFPVNPMRNLEQFIFP